MGGPRFAEIFEKFDNPHDSEDDESSTEVGDDQDGYGRPGGLHSRNGTTTTVRPLANSDDDELPSYGSSTVHPSVEDEGVEMADNYQSNPLEQAWSFNTVGGDGGNVSECGSDTAQVSSDDERGHAQGAYDQDIDMSSTVADQSDGENSKDVISVPPKAGSDRDSDEVAEIHVEGEKGSRAE